MIAATSLIQRITCACHVWVPMSYQTATAAFVACSVTVYPIWPTHNATSSNQKP